MFCADQFRLFSCPVKRPTSGFQQLLFVEIPIELDLLRYEARPARLVTSAEACPVVTVEVFIEKYMVAPVWVGLELLRAAVDRPLAALVTKEYSGQAIGYLPAHLEEVHQVSRAGGALDLEGLAVIGVKLHQRPDDQRIHREPDGPSPVGVAAKHPAVGFRWQVVNPVFLAAHPEDIGMLGVIARQ